MARLRGKVAVVTGGSMGIGKAIAAGLGHEGASLVLAARTVGPLEETVEELKGEGVEVIGVPTDVSSSADVANLFAKTKEKFGRFHILINCAGLVKDRTFLKMSEEEWDTVMGIHLKGYFLCAQAAARHFLRYRSGRIVNITSHAIFGSFGQTNYAAAKMGLLGFTKNVAMELGQFGITVNTVAPTARTRMSAGPGMEEVWLRKRATGQYAPDLPPPEGVAPLVVYLCTEQASNVNGQVLHAAGGEIGIYAYMPMAKLIYKDGFWTQDELEQIMPRSVCDGLVNPYPSNPAAEWVGPTWD